MSEIFNSLYDEIFVQKEYSTLEFEEISRITKKYMSSNATKKEKEFFLMMKTMYFRIKDIPNYQQLQKQLYTGKTKTDIIYFEISRILKDKHIDNEFIRQIDDIKQIVAREKNNISDDLYNKIIQLIIKIEISLDIKVGLFEELCCFFEEMLNKADTELSKTSLIYSKKI